MALVLATLSTLVFAVGASPAQASATPQPASGSNTLLSPFVPNNVSNFDISGFNGRVFNTAGRPTVAPGWVSSAAYGTAPFFYGVTSITAPIGTTVDIREAAFRTQASDVFDGDLTHHIERLLPANPVISQNIVIVYRITNSRGTTTFLDVQVTFEARTDFLVERVIHSIPYDDMRGTTHTTVRRGSNTDQQILGLYMMPNSSFDVRVVDHPTSGGQTALLLYTYQAIWNQNTNHGPVTDAWHTIYHGNGVTGAQANQNNVHVPRMGRVPVFVTPRNDAGHFTVELRFTLEGANSVRSLNFFNYQDANPDFGHFTITEAEWLDNWRFVPTADAEDFGQMFAIIQSPTYVMLVAWQDRFDLQLGNIVWGQGNTRTGQGIQNILDNQEHMTHWFNYWYGLCINATNPWDRLVHARQFTVPAYRGPGAAFMGHRVLGMSITSNINNGGGITRYLRINTSVHYYPTMDFLAMHELGHRYDSNFGLGEVITNVQPNFLQYMHRGHTYNNNRWNISPTATAEHRAFVDFENTFDTRLIRLMYAVESSTCRYEALQSVQSANREQGYHHLNWTRGDAFAYGIFRQSGLNVIPVIEICLGLGDRAISPAVRNHIMNSDARIAHHLYLLAPGEANVAVRNTLVADRSLVGHWSATVLGAGATSLTGTATINIDSPDMAPLIGEQIRIYDGATLIHTLPITGPTIAVPATPIGGYRVVLPRPAGLYTINTTLLVSTANTGVAEAVYTDVDPL